MNSTTIRFCCQHCGARIKAGAQLGGQRRDCPGCRRTIVVPSPPLEDAAPMLVLLEENDHFCLRPWRRPALVGG